MSKLLVTDCCGVTSILWQKFFDDQYYVAVDILCFVTKVWLLLYEYQQCSVYVLVLCSILHHVMFRYWMHAAKKYIEI